MASIEWLLFDLGGVLVEIDQSRIFDELARHSGRSADSVRRTVLAAEGFWMPFIEQEFTPSEVTNRINQLLDTKLSEEQIVGAINAELGQTITTTAELVVPLKRQTKIGCLSNTNSIHWDHLLRSYNFMHEFDRRFASQLLGSAKPSTVIYNRVVELLSVPPRSILFFDDRQDNVDAARSLGWNARLYRSHEGLLADLKEFDLG